MYKHLVKWLQVNRLSLNLDKNCVNLDKH